MGFEIGYWGIYFFSSFFASISDEDYVFFLLFWNSGMEIVGVGSGGKVEKTTWEGWRFVGKRRGWEYEKDNIGKSEGCRVKKWSGVIEKKIQNSGNNKWRIRVK